MRSIIYSLLAITLSPIVLGQWSVGQEVHTSSGAVAGHKSSKYPDVSEYLGIRYGESTAGKNRFMAPKPYIGKDKIVASQFVSIILAYSYSANTIRARKEHE
jgi:carboxylesterase type B